MGNVSAQLAQWADTRVLVALLKPKPPRDNGRELKSRAFLEHGMVGTSRIVHSPCSRHEPWQTPEHTLRMTRNW